ncbi:hypothetical protein, partial [Streptomyces sp. WSLK1-4]|uniref:hypothetical protein n=1 Tax=Streptomyces sp. WSLK1-4 TaxID=3375474 RepID=UPI0037A02912
LLHQIFSFNSPVWFNVGTPQPQQVSACFILSVDDSMESILDWCRLESVLGSDDGTVRKNASNTHSSEKSRSA